MTYQHLVNLTMGKDPVTYDIVLQILKDEVEHEEDLQAEREDLETMLRSIHKNKAGRTI
jgi:bacterioferritin